VDDIKRYSFGWDIIHKEIVVKQTQKGDYIRHEDYNEEKLIRSNGKNRIRTKMEYLYDLIDKHSKIADDVKVHMRTKLDEIGNSVIYL